MDRMNALQGLLGGFARGGAWGAVAALFVTVVEVAPLFLR
jgi:hypothetical protein